MSDLTKKELTWTDQLEDAFRKLKELMTAKPVLRCPDNDGHSYSRQMRLKEVLGSTQPKRWKRSGASSGILLLLSRERRYSTVEKIVLALSVPWNTLMCISWNDTSRYSQTTELCDTFTRWRMPTVCQLSSDKMGTSSSTLQFWYPTQTGLQNGNADGLWRTVSQQKKGGGMLGIAIPKLTLWSHTHRRGSHQPH